MLVYTKMNRTVKPGDEEAPQAQEKDETRVALWHRRPNETESSMRRNQFGVLVAMGVTNMGGCGSGLSSGSPLNLGNLRLPKESALLDVRSSIYVQKK
jgi:hypothetical protein